MVITPDRIWINDGKGHFRAIEKLALRNTSRIEDAKPNRIYEIDEAQATSPFASLHRVGLSVAQKTEWERRYS